MFEKRSWFWTLWLERIRRRKERPLADKYRGLYRKYFVKKVSDPNKKHDNCFFFVLDLDHDPYVIPALEAYADACQKTHPVLARQLRVSITSRRKE